MKVIGSKLKLGIMGLVVGIGAFQTGCRPEQVAATVWTGAVVTAIVASTPPERQEPKGRCIVERTYETCTEVRDYHGRFRKENCTYETRCTVRSHRYANQFGGGEAGVQTLGSAEHFGISYGGMQALVNTLEAASKASSDEQAFEILGTIGVTREHFNKIIQTQQAPADMIDAVARAIDASPVEVGSMFETVGNELRAKAARQ